MKKFYKNKMRAIFLSLLLASAVSAVEKTKKHSVKTKEEPQDSIPKQTQKKIRKQQKQDELDYLNDLLSANKKEKEEECKNEEKQKVEESTELTKEIEDNQKILVMGNKNEEEKKEDPKDTANTYLTQKERIAKRKEKKKNEEEKSILVIGPTENVKNPESFSLKNTHTFKNFDVFDKSNTENMFDKIIYDQCLDHNTVKIKDIPRPFIDESSIKNIAQLLRERALSFNENLRKVVGRLKEGGTLTVLLKGETIEIENESMDLLKTIKILENKEQFIQNGPFTCKGHYLFISEQTNNNENSLRIDKFIKDCENSPEVAPVLDKFKEKYPNLYMSNKDRVKKVLAPIVQLVTYNKMFSNLRMKYDGFDYIPHGKDGMSELSATYKKVGSPVTSDSVP